MSSLAKHLANYIAGYGVRAFDWEGANCCHFAAGWVAARTGANPMAGLATTPSERAARRLITALGGTLADALTRQLGREPIPPAMARLGDVVLLEHEGRPVVAICNGINAVSVVDQGGTAFLPMTLATHAWRLA